MKLSKEELIYLLRGVGTEWGSIEDVSRAEHVIDALKTNRLEIEGYERVQWTRFDPKNPKTFPPKNGYLDVFELSKKHEWRSINKLNEFWWQKGVESWTIDVNSRGHTIFWRPIPPTPGKEEQQ